jgi:hypothetical protein
VFAHVGNLERGGSHSCTLVFSLGRFLLGRPNAFVVFLEFCDVPKLGLFFVNPRLERFAQSLTLEQKCLEPMFLRLSSLWCRWTLTAEICLKNVADWKM